MGTTGGALWGVDGGAFQSSSAPAAPPEFLPSAKKHRPEPLEDILRRELRRRRRRKMFADLLLPAYPIDEVAPAVALLKDFAVGEISAQGNSTATTISTTATWTLVDEPTFSLTTEAAWFDTPQNGRLRYRGDTAKPFWVQATVSFSGVAAANDTFALVLIKNATVNGSNEYSTGTIITASQITRKLGAGGDVGAVALQAFVTLSRNDYIELFLRNEEVVVADVTVEDANIGALGFRTEV